MTPAKRVLFIILLLLLISVVAFSCLLLYLTVTEYNPPDMEPVTITSGAVRSISPGDSLSIMTWNIGYCALGDNSDFFMDGGRQVQTATPERVLANMVGITDTLIQQNTDICFLQEVDVDSARSYTLNAMSRISTVLSERDSAFAANYKVAFVPYPIPPIGRVNSGIATFSAFPIEYADRIQLPCPFSWPVRVGNLKRCLLVSRIPLKDTDRELVLINLHLEAFDDGSGKVAQAASLREYMNAELEKGNYLIVGGDFNQRFSNVDGSAYPEYEGKWHPGLLNVSDFSDGYTFVMDNTVPSCRSLDQPYAGADHSTFQYYLIDGFIVSPNVQIDLISTLDLGFVSSDHNPVVMKVTLLP
ncbi:MAG: endonuclease/exonuclease/phosphatase family protein [Clostridia bacterium]|nr:endonuclease/exonuclease/phosphatase family protein [Clostridia bacterium]